MNTASTTQSTTSREATVIRLGGLAGLSILGLYVLITFVLTRFPGPSSVPFGELKTYILDHAGAMAVGNGLRYLVLVCIAFFAVGMYTFTGRGATLTGNAWGILGLLGAAALMANGAVSNAVLTFAYLSFAKLSEQPEHFMLQSNLSRVLFTVGQLFWGLMIGGFSIATGKRPLPEVRSNRSRCRSVVDFSRADETVEQPRNHHQSKIRTRPHLVPHLPSCPEEIG
jgi:hypothetical protein